MKKVLSYLLVLFVGVVLGAVFFGPIGVIPEETIVPATLSCGEPQVIEVPVEVTSIPPVGQGNCSLPPSEPWGIEDVKLYVLDPGRIATVVESLLLTNSAYQDPRVSCSDVTEGIILGETGLCIPKNPPVGFCVAGSEDYPCDMVLVAIDANVANEGGFVVPGATGDFKLEYMFVETYETYLTVDSPVELDAIVLPVSSAHVPLFMEMDMIHMKSFTIVPLEP